MPPAKPRKRKQTKRAVKAPRWVRFALLGAILTLLALLVCMRISAQTVHVRFTTVNLADLPQAFDGTTILYATDINIHGQKGADAASALFQELRYLQPDLVLLGGDYSSSSLTNQIFGKRNNGTDTDIDLSASASAFLKSLWTLNAPLGKYAIAGEDDQNIDSLRAAMDAGGVSFLSNDTFVLSRDASRIIIVGLSDAEGQSAYLNQLNESLGQGECVILLAHTPELFPMLQTTEAHDGGPLADLVLSGHTLGGQISLGELSVHELSDAERQYRRGWRREGGTVWLTSMGIGCKGLNLRLGTEAEVHLITLRRQEQETTDFEPFNPSAEWSP